MAADGGTSERIEGPTPSGGVASVAHWRDARGNPCRKADATAAEIHELDADGRCIARTYATLRRD